MAAAPLDPTLTSPYRALAREPFPVPALDLKRLKSEYDAAKEADRAPIAEEMSSIAKMAIERIKPLVDEAKK
jgi:hypothetical protein